jgi:phage portal protein BeeE
MKDIAMIVPQSFWNMCVWFNRAFWRQTVLPLVARVQKSFQAWLQPGFGSFRLDYNADRLEALASERAAEWERVTMSASLERSHRSCPTF